MVPMPRPTQPQQADQLYARAIFTPTEYAALTSDDLALLDSDLTAALEAQRVAGSYTYDSAMIDNTEVLNSEVADGTEEYVVVSKTVFAWPFGVSA
jgi:hypothetical protein